MSNYDIKATDEPEYWFIEVDGVVTAGVTDVGLHTTSKHPIEHGKNRSIMLGRLKEKEHKLNPAGTALEKFKRPKRKTKK
jgi:hypothetical protein